MENLTKFTKYGSIGVAIASLILCGMVIDRCLDIFESQNLIFNNHMSDYIEAQNLNTTAINSLSNNIDKFLYRYEN